MLDSLKNYIFEQVTHPNKKEVDEILALFEEQHFQKGDLFKKPFVEGTNVAFLAKGAVRIIIYKENGDEITARIRQDNSFIFDPFRLKDIKVSPLGIECLEEQTLLVTPIVEVQKLLETNLALNIVIRKHIMEQLGDLAQNQYLFLTATAKERYTYLLKNKPAMLKKFPLRFIASMIGITPTQLSRIRKEK